jgi:RHS repeat-associated protein
MRLDRGRRGALAIVAGIARGVRHAMAKDAPRRQDAATAAPVVTASRCGIVARAILRAVGSRPAGGLVGAVILVVVVATPIGAGAARPSEPRPTPPTAAPGARHAPPPVRSAGALSGLTSLSGGAIAPDDIAAAERQRAAAEKQGVRLATPEARRARQRSRTRYRGLGASAALGVARTHHGRWLREPAWSPPQPGPLERMGRHRGDSAVLVERAGEEQAAIAVSSTPLVSDAGSGREAPVDLALEASGAAFGPRNPVIDTRLPRRLEEGVEFVDDGIELRFTASAGPNARRIEDKLFYGNVATDTDLVVEPLPSGVSTYYQLRSPAAPAALEVAVAPGGGAFELAAGGGAELHQDGLRVLDVSAPVAFDAQGSPVPARFSVAGGALRIDVDHQGRDVAYPILVDPTYVRSEQQYTGFYGWSFSTPWPGFFNGGYCPTCSPDSGLWLQTAAGRYFGSLTYGWWTMPTPNYSGGTAYTFRMDWHGLRHRAPVYACVTLGLWTPSIGDWQRNGIWNDVPTGTSGTGPYVNCSAQNGSPTTCVSNCAWDAPPGTHPAFQQWMYGAGTRAGSDLMWVRNPILFMSDYDNPTVTRSYWSAAEGPTGWTRYSTLYGQMSATDRGLGIYDVWTQPSAGLDVDEVFSGDPTACSGDWSPPRCANTWAANYDVHPLWEGTHTITLHAMDVIDRRAAPYTHVVKYDATPPAVEYSGRLESLDGRSTAEDATLEIVARDGSATALRSGVRGVYVYVDGALVQSTGDLACPQGSCAAPKQTYVFKPANYSLATHRIEVRSCDWAGNCASRTWNVTPGTGKMTTVQEGQHTARRVTLGARRVRGTATQARFQFRRSDDPSWRDIPLAALRTRRGEPVTGWPLALDANGETPTLVWDLFSTPELRGTNGLVSGGGIQVRAVYPGQPETVSDDILTVLDHSGMATDDATTTVNPVDVDVVTGNASFTETDVSVSAFKAQLEVARTYNSRDTDAEAARPFGPGWRLATDASGTVIFAKVVNMAESTGDTAGAYALAVTGDGNDVVFSERAGDTGYVSELGFEQFQLARVLAADGTIQRFTLKDAQAGETLTFEPSGVRGEYTLTSLVQTESGDNTTYSYGPVPGGAGKRITRMLAPVPPGVSCAPALVRGCRALEFDYATTTGDGDYAGRLKTVRLRTWDPAGSQMADIPVARYAYDGAGRLVAAWDPRISPALKSEYAYDSSNRLVQVTPPGEKPWTLEYAAAATDPDPGRLRSVTREALPPAAGSATRTLVYGVPVSGAPGLPDVGAAQLDETAQVDMPVEGTAVFRPDDLPGTSPSFSAATVSFFNGDGRLVNEVEPGGRVSATEYDALGNVTRELTAANRQRALALATAAERRAKALELSTLRTWETNDAGSRLALELGPAHALQLASGAVVTGRRRTVFAYDAGRPDTKNYNLPTRRTVDALVGTTGHDARVTETKYDFARRLVTDEIVDPGGLALRTVTVYDENGLAVERRQPRHPGGGAASTTQTVRYAAGSSPVAECANRPEWAGLPCVERRAAQPATSGDRPEIPSATIIYNLLNQPIVTTESSTSGTRTTTMTYDAAGRELAMQVTGSPGAGIAVIESDYSPTTGELVRSRAIDGAAGRIVERVFDDLGRERSYTDAHGATTTTTYDLLDRPVSATNPSGSQTYAYDAVTGALSRVTDSDVGTITPTYDADFNVTSQLFGTSGLRLDVTYDEAGATTRRAYVKAGCSSACTWFESQAIEDVHGEQVEHTGTQGERAFAYDRAGRLVRADDREPGAGCVTREYGLDANGNRTSRTTWPAGATCRSGTPASVAYTYDDADRLADGGYVYDAFGRTLRVPARDAGGSELTATYYLNDRVRSLSQAGRELTFELDPLLRQHSRTETGRPATALHYASDADEVSWSTQDGAVERQIADVAGELAAIRDGSQTRLQLSDLHGDIVGSVLNSASASRPAALAATDEFGVPKPAPRIQFVGATSAALSSPARALTVNRPTTAQPGDLLVAEIAADSFAFTSAPSGWTKVGGSEVISGLTQTVVFVHAVGSGEPGSYTFAFSQGGRHRGGVKVLRNASTDQPPVAAKATGAGGSPELPSVVPPRDDSALSAFLGVDHGDANGGSMFLFPSPLTTAWETKSGATADDRMAGSATVVQTGGGGVATPAYPVVDLGGFPAGPWAAVTTAVAPAPPPVQDRYRYLGVHQRSTELPSGVITMGARVYLPQIGRFLQTDPVEGGSCNAYEYACHDPVNNVDLDGQCVGPLAALAPVCIRVAATGVVAGFRFVARAGRVGRVTRRVTWASGAAKINFKNLLHSAHSWGRMYERGISRRAVRKTLREGTIYWDPKNATYSFFRATRGGKLTQVAVDPLLGVIKTVIRVKKIPKRMTKAEFQ